jgi:hypothetical protein
MTPIPFRIFSVFFSIDNQCLMNGNENKEKRESMGKKEKTIDPLISNWE